MAFTELHEIQASFPIACGDVLGAANPHDEESRRESVGKFLEP